MFPHHTHLKLEIMAVMLVVCLQWQLMTPLPGFMALNYILACWLALELVTWQGDLALELAEGGGIIVMIT